MTKKEVVVTGEVYMASAETIKILMESRSELCGTAIVDSVILEKLESLIEKELDIYNLGVDKALHKLKNPKSEVRSIS